MKASSIGAAVDEKIPEVFVLFTIGRSIDIQRGVARQVFNYYAPRRTVLYPRDSTQHAPFAQYSFLDRKLTRKHPHQFP